MSILGLSFIYLKNYSGNFIFFSLSFYFMDMSERNLFELLNIVVTKVGGKKIKIFITQILNPCIDMFP